MKKRGIALILAAIMVLMTFVFAACNNETTPDSKDPAGEVSTEEGTDAPAADAASDLDDIKAKGELVIGITYFSPMNYLDDNNELIGFETEFAKAVCEKLGVEAKFQEIIWDSKVMELNSGSIDCIWNGMTMTEDLAPQIDFSTPYMANKQVCVIRTEDADTYTDLASMNGAAVVAESGSAGETAATSDPNLAANFISVTAQADGLNEVKAGTSDIAVMDAVMAYSMVGENTDFNDLTVLDVFGDDANEQYAVGFRKGSSLTAAVNTAMEELAADGTLDQIARTYGLESRILLGE